MHEGRLTSIEEYEARFRASLPSVHRIYLGGSSEASRVRRKQRLRWISGALFAILVGVSMIKVGGADIAVAQIGKAQALELKTHC